MRNLDRNLYRTVRSTSTPASSDMLGETDDENEHMTQIEMHQTFIQPSPMKSSHHNEFKQLLSSKNEKQKKKFKIHRNNKRQNDNVFIFDIFERCKRNRKKLIDNRERSIRYNNATCIKVYRENKKYSVGRFARNTINNQKYSLLTFFPLFLFEQFNQFWNLYFLFVAITQLPIRGSIFEDFWIGYWWTTVLPLVFVVSISMMREIFDDLQRKKRDFLINHEKYKKINISNGIIESIASCKIKIGDLIILNEGDRVPCDMILLYCENENGSTFIKTDQLDGETDWKLRRAIPSIQKYYTKENIFKLNGILSVEAPHLDIYKFIAKFEHLSDNKNTNTVDALTLENTLWGSTRIASEGICIGCCVYLGEESRQQLNANDKTIKIGLIDKELNKVTKILVFMLVCIAFILTISRGIHLNSYLYFGRFLLILSDIIPLSLRVYMDLSKIWFSFMIQRDKLIPNTTVRCTTIPEELGRIQYLFSDKTGTLTKNEMIFQKLQLKPPLLFQSHNFKLIHHHFVNEILNSPKKKKRKSKKQKEKETQGLLRIDELQIKLQNEIKSNRVLFPKQHFNNNNNKSVSLQVYEALEALAICHNVTPIINDDNDNKINYEASSPDEIAMVKFTEKCGVKLIHRTPEEIRLRIYQQVYDDNDNDNVDDDEYKYDDDYIDLHYEILNIFPFTSESKRMGIIIKSFSKGADGEITFYSKGADVVMKNMIESGAEEWMDEEVENLSREGLRTLVFAKRQLTNDEYNSFLSKYNAASISMNASRKIQMESIRQSLLEQDMQLLCVTGVEDKLQDNVQSTIEILRNAHIKIWMLTGDKIETAKVIARSSRLISYGQEIYELIVKNNSDAYRKLDILYGKTNTNNLAIIIDGKSLEIFMNSGDDNLRQQFLEYMIECHVVISCRCSPTQKAEIVKSVQKLTKKVCCAIGDGGNDVSMILAANVGVGLLGKEGRQASLSSDFSIIKFEYLSILLLWHGRLSYKNTSVISQFVIHRGLIIAFITVFFSIIFYFAAVPLFTGALMVGYTCIYTSLPVFSLVLDCDISFENALFYPELYHSLQSGLSLNNKTFLLWIMRSFFQGSCIMLFTLILFENEVHNIVSITFTALILTELYNVYLEIHKIHFLMIISELLSIILYIISIFIFSKTYFDKQFVFSSTFLFKSFIISVVANVPVFVIKFIHKKCNPSMQAKLKDDQQ